MEFHILGPLQVHAVDSPSHTLSPRLTRVLAVLLLAANRTVTRRHLIEAVWDDTQPETAHRQVRNCIWALRRHLGVSGLPRQSISAEASGYRIGIDPGQLDALVFKNQVERATDLIAIGRVAEAAQWLRMALALWRGPALAGIPGRAIEAAAVRLDEERLSTVEQYLDLELRLGRHERVIGELTEFVAGHPFREKPVGLLMLALHRSGRQAEALDAYDRLRVRLVDELGLDPITQLADLRTAILRDQVPLSRTYVGGPCVAVGPDEWMLVRIARGLTEARRRLLIAVAEAIAREEGDIG